LRPSWVRLLWEASLGGAPSGRSIRSVPAGYKCWPGSSELLGLITALYSLAFFTVAALCSWIVATIDGQPATWPAAIVILAALGSSWLIFGCWALFGMALAYLFRQSAMAIGIGLVYLLIIERVLAEALGGFDASWVTDAERLLAGQNANALVQSFGQVFPESGVSAPIATASEAALALAVYALLFVAVSTLVVRIRDVA
jgi:ABC-2 type transport system permease protein